MKHHPIQISIPQPCSEDWNKMTPQEQGRFCDSCQKCVVDFTGFTDEQLYKYLTKNKGKKICGLFSDLQVDRPIFRPNTRRDYFQWVMSLGFIVFLTNLIGIKAKAQEPIKKEWLSSADNRVINDSLHSHSGIGPGKVTGKNNREDSSKGRYASIDSGTVRISDGNEIRTLYIIDGIRIINTKEINNRESIEFVEPPIHGLPAKYSNYNNER